MNSISNRVRVSALFLLAVFNVSVLGVLIEYSYKTEDDLRRTMFMYINYEKLFINTNNKVLAPSDNNNGDYGPDLQLTIKCIKEAAKSKSPDPIQMLSVLFEKYSAFVNTVLLHKMAFSYKHSEEYELTPEVVRMTYMNNLKMISRYLMTFAENVPHGKVISAIKNNKLLKKLYGESELKKELSKLEEEFNKAKEVFDKMLYRIDNGIGDESVQEYNDVKSFFDGWFFNLLYGETLIHKGGKLPEDVEPMTIPEIILHADIVNLCVRTLQETRFDGRKVNLVLQTIEQHVAKAFKELENHRDLEKLLFNYDLILVKGSVHGVSNLIVKLTYTRNEASSSGTNEPE